jgi:hypothetical protein
MQSLYIKKRYTGPGYQNFVQADGKLQSLSDFVKSAVIRNCGKTDKEREDLEWTKLQEQK